MAPSAIETTFVDAAGGFRGSADHLGHIRRRTSKPSARIATSFSASRWRSHAVLWKATLSVSTITPHSGQ
jgi:hypothetical protein